MNSRSGTKSTEADEARCAFRLRGLWLAGFALALLAVDLLFAIPFLTEGQGGASAGTNTVAPKLADTCPPPEFAAFYGAPLDVNQADPRTLSLLPGIGPVLAERIVAYRETNGPFVAPADLLQVQGIGAKMLAGLLPQICLK